MIEGSCNKDVGILALELLLLGDFLVFAFIIMHINVIAFLISLSLPLGLVPIRIKNLSYSLL